MKEILIIFLGLIANLVFADSTSTIQLPASFVSDLIAQVTALFGNFSPYIVLIVGVLLITIVIEIIVGALRRH